MSDVDLKQVMIAASACGAVSAYVRIVAKSLERQSVGAQAEGMAAVSRMCLEDEARSDRLLPPDWRELNRLIGAVLDEGARFAAAIAPLSAQLDALEKRTMDHIRAQREAEGATKQ